MNKRHHDECSIGSQLYSGLLYSCLVVYTLVFLFGRCFLPPVSEWCPYSMTQHHLYKNPDYNDHPCQRYRTPYLLYLHLQEVEFAQRMIFALILGGIIGFERRASERPAGIRTMSMVCLGSCFFSMCGQLAFKSSTMGWDAARVAAAVPSGVGFLGAGLIWKGSTSSVKNVDGQEVTTQSQEVHGLTTAASVWLAAAVGVAVGGGRRLYIVSVYGVMLVILVLRFGPNLFAARDSESNADFDDEVDTELDSSDWGSISSDLSLTGHEEEESNLEYSYASSSRVNDQADSSYDDDAKDTTHERYTDPAIAGTNHPRKSSSSLSRNASAPDIMQMTYEVPLVDHSRDIMKGSKSMRQRRRGKSGANIMKFSFHG